MKLWDKGLNIDNVIEKFTIGNDRETDLLIAKYDIQASIAHAQMLRKVNLITENDLLKLEKGLSELNAQIMNGTFIIEPKFEDVHSKIEFELTKKYGDVGKLIHTARSRNDQILVALHLYYKDHLQQLQQKVKTFFNTLLNLADTYKNKLMPGYTHLQLAMPSSFGLWFSAYAELIIDDMYLFDAALKTVDQNPLGSAAGYGSSFPIDRDFTTKALNFSTLKYNVIAAQMSRGKSERTIASAFGSLASTLSRFAMDICLYMGQNFDFISFPDKLTTGSSIMPHKKNPDVFELIRGKCNKMQALYPEIVMITNNLPSGYHRDFQILKENVIHSFIEMDTILEVFNYTIQHIIVKDIDFNDEKYKYLFTVDSINNLVVQGVPFRDAYLQVGKEVNEGNYIPDTSKLHTHIGSIHNLGLEQIRLKYDSLNE